MDYSELSDKAAENMRLALPLMKKHGVPMTPDNYAVWYEHVSGANAELSEKLQAMLTDNPILTESQCTGVYEQFFNVEKELVQVVEMRQELARLLKEVISFVYSTVAQTDRSNNHLAELLTRINRDMSPQEVHEVVEQILDETRQAMSNGEQLTERLNTAVAEVQTLKKELDQSKREAKTDTLTGLANRKAFDELVTKVTQDADNSGLDVCILFCDLDIFKEVNDKHGHLVGDQVLKVVSNTLKDSVKGRDLVARYGGEEFSIILLNTSLQNAKILADNIRKEIASKRIQRKDTRESLGQITMSFGVARYVPTEGVESFMQRADRALYMSKRKGRNCVSEAPPPII
ncbi:GGDEF domain-containing protein [Methylophaga thiooxydans]|uniref:diguanylate cyclase n=1 Tax=Methylophaga thiooxydans DMS010 TaxID=637616 RepID=C0N985_9GAMM|nr:GGDEF domain-containing protein [Methylophaga thiooxydans]EEF78648.1 GGDEF domain protein [Methylophaga thiooxydans DMS010]|mmetsp:Transcript_19415/g.25126  ORF Transcript_19415/g.25126 Transcript_19415/m.25126 type:complete len:346 (+) Transcript_19415:696-1733(+)